MNLYFYKGKYPSFLLVNTLGWSAYFIIDTLVISEPYTLNKFSFFLENTLLVAIGFLITCALRFSYKKYQYRTKPLSKVLVYLISASFLAGALWYATMVAALLIFRPDDKNTIQHAFTFQFTVYKLAAVIPTMTSWSLLYFGIKFWFEWSLEKERAEKADYLAQSAQLQMLRYQINPHFLFNSFSSLRALIRTDKDKAEEMVTKLSEFYRYSLSTRNSKEVPLIDEIEAINLYFELEKIRFGNKIESQIEIDPLAEDYPVPAFLIHPLIENAIKYGMKTSPLPLKINLKAEVEKTKLRITVTNTGSWFDDGDNKEAHGTGAGLANIKSRLDFSYPNNHKFEIIKEADSVKILIEITRTIK